LIELLTVIAIIGILSAIIFPVYARVKDSAYRSSDMSNMNSLRTAIQLYKTDQGAYPPQLLGYVTTYQSGPQMGQIIPANLLTAALYSKRVEAIDTFKPAYLRQPDSAFNTETTAVWPSGNTGGVTPASCPASPASAPCALQAFGPADGFVSYDANNNIGVTGTPFEYYTVSGYDTASVRSTTGQRRELRYALFWSAYGLNAGSASDSLNQLGYSEPPETTVITWDSYFREYDATGAIVPGEKREIVLFIGGGARPFDSTVVFTNAWQTHP